MQIERECYTRFFRGLFWLTVYERIYRPYLEPVLVLIFSSPLSMLYFNCNFGKV
jgi:hypothetical protein